MKRKAFALIGVLSLVSLAACGDDDSSSTADTTAAATADTTAAATEDTTAAATADTTAAAAVSLAGVCPDTVTFQTDWNPESEHRFLYQMVGDGYEVDAKEIGRAHV